MNDKRELLELAAKAAGITGEWARWHQAYGDVWVEGLNTGSRFLWNPIEDDGDALRLAVKLRLDISFNDAAQCVYADESMEPFTRTPDPYAATRLAIVRAAAEVGRGILQIISDDTWPEDNYYATQAEAQGFRKVEE